MILVWLLKKSKQRKLQEEGERERDARASEMITDLKGRKEVAEGFLIPRQRRNHWQEAIATMIHSAHP